MTERQSMNSKSPGLLKDPRTGSAARAAGTDGETRGSGRLQPSQRSPPAVEPRRQSQSVTMHQQYAEFGDIILSGNAMGTPEMTPPQRRVESFSGSHSQTPRKMNFMRPPEGYRDPERTPRKAQKDPTGFNLRGEVPLTDEDMQAMLMSLHTDTNLSDQEYRLQANRLIRGLVGPEVQRTPNQFWNESSLDENEFRDDELPEDLELPNTQYAGTGAIAPRPTQASRGQDSTIETEREVLTESHFRATAIPEYSVNENGDFALRMQDSNGEDSQAWNRSVSDTTLLAACRSAERNAEADYRDRNPNNQPPASNQYGTGDSRKPSKRPAAMIPTGSGNGNGSTMAGIAPIRTPPRQPRSHLEILRERKMELEREIRTMEAISEQRSPGQMAAESEETILLRQLRDQMVDMQYVLQNKQKPVRQPPVPSPHGQEQSPAKRLRRLQGLVDMAGELKQAQVQWREQRNPDPQLQEMSEEVQQLREELIQRENIIKNLQAGDTPMQVPRVTPESTKLHNRVTQLQEQIRERDEYIESLMLNQVPGAPARQVNDLSHLGAAGGVDVGGPTGGCSNIQGLTWDTPLAKSTPYYDNGARPRDVYYTPQMETTPEEPRVPPVDRDWAERHRPEREERGRDRNVRRRRDDDRDHERGRENYWNNRTIPNENFGAPVYDTPLSPLATRARKDDGKFVLQVFMNQTCLTANTVGGGVWKDYEKDLNQRISDLDELLLGEKLPEWVEPAKASVEKMEEAWEKYVDIFLDWTACSAVPRGVAAKMLKRKALAGLKTGKCIKHMKSEAKSNLNDMLNVLTWYMGDPNDRENSHTKFENYRHDGKETYYDMVQTLKSHYAKWNPGAPVEQMDKDVKRQFLKAINHTPEGRRLWLDIHVKNLAQITESAESVRLMREFEETEKKIIEKKLKADKKASDKSKSEPVTVMADSESPENSEDESDDEQDDGDSTLMALSNFVERQKQRNSSTNKSGFKKAYGNNGNANKATWKNGNNQGARNNQNYSGQTSKPQGGGYKFKKNQNGDDYKKNSSKQKGDGNKNGQYPKKDADRAKKEKGGSTVETLTRMAYKGQISQEAYAQALQSLQRLSIRQGGASVNAVGEDESPTADNDLNVADDTSPQGEGSQTTEDYASDDYESGGEDLLN